MNNKRDEFDKDEAESPEMQINQMFSGLSTAKLRDLVSASEMIVNENVALVSQPEVLLALWSLQDRITEEFGDEDGAIGGAIKFLTSFVYVELAKKVLFEREMSEQ
jgi:hypothetical protein